MSTLNNNIVDILKNALHELQQGTPKEKIKEKYGSYFSKISPVEVVVAEQKLMESGVPVKDIVQFCDLHVELIREYLSDVTIKDLPRFHPLSLLIRENEEILKLAEGVPALAFSLSRENSEEMRSSLSKQLILFTKRLRGLLRAHYRKNQMLIFPYLERAGIVAPPRVLWSIEDEVIRDLWNLEKNLSENKYNSNSIVEEATQISRKISELVFRENRILYPTMKALLREANWKAVHLEAKRIGYIVPLEEDWNPPVEPEYPYQFVRRLTQGEIEKLPEEIKAFAMSAVPDEYTIEKEDDIRLKNGFLGVEELEGVMKGLPLEITFADTNDRIRFFSESEVSKGFPRSKTIVGRNLLYCHPPRLEKYIQLNIDLLKKNKEKYREFWTRLGDRILRVLVVGVRDEKGNYIGTMEVVEDFTEILLHSNEILEKKLVVL